MGVMCTNWSELAPSPQISTNLPQQPTSFPLRICCNLSLFCLFFTLLSACLLELHCPSGQPLATDGGLNLNSLNCIKLKVQFTLKVLNSHIWLFATILYTNDLENFHYCRKFYWTSLVQMWCFIDVNYCYFGVEQFGVIFLFIAFLDPFIYFFGRAASLVGS